MLRSLRTALFWVAGLLLIFVAANINDPYLVPIRPWIWIGLLLASLAGLFLLPATKIWSERGLAGRFLVLVWVAPLASLAGAELIFELRKHEVLAVSQTEAMALGRHFLIGYSSLEDVEPLVDKGLIGGIFITQHNIAGRSAQDLHDEIAQLQMRRRFAGMPPLIVAADQEGGLVAHLSPPLTRFPRLADLASLPEGTRENAARAQGEHQGRELAALGVTLDFAPVVDLQNQLADTALDFNSHIAGRAISDDPAIVAAVALAFAQGLEAAGVGATAKHFPGLGNVAEDTHHFSGHLGTPLAKLESADWRPFRTLLTQSNSALMLGHVMVDAIDPSRPASHSRQVIHDLIRKTWGFDGLIITDDIVMGPVYQHGLCTAVVEGLNAGVDLLLVAYDGRQFYRAVDCALAAWRQGDIAPEALTQSVTRLDAYSRSRQTAAMSK